MQKVKFIQFIIINFREVYWIYILKDNFSIKKVWWILKDFISMLYIKKYYNNFIIKILTYFYYKIWKDMNI